METIQARVSKQLLAKASRLFTGTLDGRIIEILQNARRAGASEVHITNEDGEVTVRDNGCGIDDFARLLDLGASGWEDELEASEDPAGVGLFCLAPRDTVIRSNGKMARIGIVSYCFFIMTGLLARLEGGAARTTRLGMSPSPSRMGIVGSSYWSQ